MDGIFLFILLIGALVAIDLGALRSGVDVRDRTIDAGAPARDVPA